MSTRTWWRRPGVVAALVVPALLAGTAGGAGAAFRSTDSIAGNAFEAVDVDPPAVTRTTASRTATPGVAGQVRQGGAYRLYAQVDDARSGVLSVAGTPQVGPGGGPTALTSAGGPWTVAGQSYNFRSAEVVVRTPLRVGQSYATAFSALDRAGQTAAASGSLYVQTYADALVATPGLVDHYRLDDNVIAVDDFDDDFGKSLQSTRDQLGNTWTRRLSSPTGTGAVVRDVGGGRIRKTGTGQTIYVNGRTPPSADYEVEVEVHVASLTGSSVPAVFGRVNGTGTTFYMGRYDEATQEVQLWKSVNGTRTQIGSAVVGLPAVGDVVTLELDLKGDKIVLEVDGDDLLDVTDGSITAAGRAGLGWGHGATNNAHTDTTAMHLDNFRWMTQGDQIANRASPAHPGTEKSTALGAPGGMVGDLDRAAYFDGDGDYVDVRRSVADDFSLEIWFRSTQTDQGSERWADAAQLMDADVNGPGDDFGMSLYADGRVAAGSGPTSTSARSGLNDGAWHHAVFTRERSLGRERIYVDGVLEASSTTGDTTALDSSPRIRIGASAGQTDAHEFHGHLDEAAVYDRALTAAEVLDHYRAGTGTG